MQVMVQRYLLACALLMPIAAHAQQKVIVLGFDGVDAKYTEKWMNEGKLPNLARLRAEGTFRPLRPTVPAQTPVSWSTFSTGIDPGRTGIFDFLRRDTKNYMPTFAAFDEVDEPFLLGDKNPIAFAAIVFVLFALIALFFRRVARIAVLVLAVLLAAGAFVVGPKLIPKQKPTVVNRRQGTPFWEVAAAAGRKARAVHIPATFPAHDFPAGEMLSGLGVPDMSGRVGKPFYFTSELDFHRADAANEFSIQVVQLEDNKGEIHTTIQGPPNKL